MTGIRNPSYGNSFTFDAQIIVKRLPSGELKISKQAIRPQLERFKIVIEELDETQRDTLEAFFIASAGQEIDYEDHEARTWHGIILTNPIVFTDRRALCGWTTEFEFEGTVSA